MIELPFEICQRTCHDKCICHAVSLSDTDIVSRQLGLHKRSRTSSYTYTRAHPILYDVTCKWAHGPCQCDCIRSRLRGGQLWMVATVDSDCSKRECLYAAAGRPARRPAAHHARIAHNTRSNKGMLTSDQSEALRAGDCHIPKTLAKSRQSIEVSVKLNHPSAKG